MPNPVQGWLLVLVCLRIRLFARIIVAAAVIEADKKKSHMGNEDASNRSAKNVDTSMSTPLPSRQTQILHVFVQLQRTNSEPAKRCVHDNPESKAIELLASIQSHELAAACLGGFNARLTWKAPKRGGSVVHATMTMSICMGPAMSLLPADDVLAFAQMPYLLLSNGYTEKKKMRWPGSVRVHETLIRLSHWIGLSEGDSAIASVRDRLSPA
ncbi:hypothetical protein CI102_13661 [Trichoderma harzianum]|nr:hypothetical protein CI102_13661 [Trichoderma harzianum]